MKLYPSTGAPGSPDVAAFYEEASGSWQYVAWCPETRKAMIVDPVLDFDPAAGATWTYSADELIHFVADQNLDLEWVLDTHPHADHFSAASYIKEQLGGAPKQGMGKLVLKVQDIWSDLYVDQTLANRAEYWDTLFEPGDSFSLGNCTVRVSLSTGHTLASITYTVGDAVFAHDTLMMPDCGTSRADFPGASSSELWDSIQAILSNPDAARIFVGHDYRKDGREEACMATVAQQKAGNIHVKEGTAREDFIAVRDARDATLPLPGRMLFALYVNIRGGRLPEGPDGGGAVLLTPLNRFTSPQARRFQPTDA